MIKIKAVVVEHFFSSFDEEAHKVFDAIQEDYNEAAKHNVWEPMSRFCNEEIAENMLTLYENIINAITKESNESKEANESNGTKAS